MWSSYINTRHRALGTKKITRGLGALLYAGTRFNGVLISLYVLFNFEAVETSDRNINRNLISIEYLLSKKESK